MPTLIDYVPDADSFVALQPEDLGMILLQMIQRERGPRVTPSNFEMPVWNANSPSYPHHKREAVGRAFAEAWQWLQNEGLLMIDMDQPNGWFCLTRKGRKLDTPEAIAAYRHGNLLPVGLLHPRLAEKVRPMFLRGDYDVAVFQAFKEVEVAVRKATRSSDSSIGVKLMRDAFRPNGGILTDKDADPGEQVALMELFTGAIGHCKNPTSHRNVEMERVSAAQLIVLASNLLSHVEAIEFLRDIGLGQS